MAEAMNNYALQVKQAKKHFLTYDQQELIRRCKLRYDAAYFYMDFLGEPYRVCRKTGDMARFHKENWVAANDFGEVMTILDWLCDSRADRYVTGRWINVVTHGHYFHGSLQDDVNDANASLFDRQPERFAAACEAMGGKAMPGADIGYAIDFLDGLQIFVQFWHGDEEFPPRVRCLWDENTTRYIRYETTWYALGLLMERIKENMQM